MKISILIIKNNVYNKAMFARFFVILLFGISLFSCSKYYSITKYENKIPKWYVDDRETISKIYGKALGESESLEMANRKAEALAVGNIVLKIKSQIDDVKNQYLADRYKKSDGKVKTLQQNDFEEKIFLAIIGYEISQYRVSKKKIFKDKNNYKVFVEIEFNKKELFKALDKIN